MSVEEKEKIIMAWNRFISERQRRYRNNEGSSIQFEDTCRKFREGIRNHPALSKKEKDELLLRLGLIQPS